MSKNKTTLIRENVEAILRKSSGNDDCIDRIAMLDRFSQFLLQWTETHNLVSSKNNVDDIWGNIYDSLIVLSDDHDSFFKKIIDEKIIVDAGTGGGFPGVPLSIVFPDKKFLLVDDNRKKCSFLRMVKAQLNLKNISVHHGKIENIDPAPFIVTKAAFSPPNIGILQPALAPGGGLLIWAAVSTSDALCVALKKCGLILEENTAYSFAHHPDRNLLLFRKER